MEAKQLAEIQARCEAKTDGEWTLRDNRDFIASSHGDIRNLLTHIDEQAKEVKSGRRLWIDAQRACKKYALRADEQAKEIERLTNDIKETVIPICSYCGKRWPKDPIKDWKPADEYLAHAATCRKNPLVLEIEQLKGLVKTALDDTGKFITNQCTDEQAGEIERLKTANEVFEVALGGWFGMVSNARRAFASGCKVVELMTIIDEQVFAKPDTEPQKLCTDACPFKTFEDADV